MIMKHGRTRYRSKMICFLRVDIFLFLVGPCFFLIFNFSQIQERKFFSVSPTLSILFRGPVSPLILVDGEGLLVPFPQEVGGHQSAEVLLFGAVL